jgi:signal transduction histidine kinase
MTSPTYTVLIVDDLQIHRELFRNFLLTDSNCEYHILEAESVKAGIELCGVSKRDTTAGKAEAMGQPTATPSPSQGSANSTMPTGKIDAILLDYTLPDGNGLEFIAKLQAQSNGSIPPVVMITGRGDESIAVQAIKLGAEDYLAKFNLSPARLQSVVASAIENARLRLQLQQSHDLLQASVDTIVQTQQEQERFFDLSIAALEAHNQELDNFVHIVSHDLKAPLRAVANLSQWIADDLEGKVPANTRSQLTLLRNRVNRMAATIDGLLDYARIGRTADLVEPVCIAELLAETIESLAPPPTFSIVIAPDLPTLNTKRILLFQVFTNLIGNAIVHHDRSDGSIVISGQGSGDFYEFGVTDDGAGIAPENHAKIFTIFQTVNPQNRPDSTGIGLAIVKKIIEAEGGNIRLESELGRGSTFYFTWPKSSN